MKSIQKKFTITIGAICAACILFTLIQSFRIISFDPKLEEEFRDYSSGWEIETDGNETTMSHVLGEEDYGETLYFISSFSLVEASVDGEQIYERETYSTPKNAKAPTNGSNFIHLPKQGNMLTLHITRPYRFQGIGMQKFILGDEYAIRLNNEMKYLLHFFLDVIMTVFGVVFSIHGIYRIVKHIPWRRQLFIGICAIIIAMWFITGTVDVEINRIPLKWEMIISYLSWLIYPMAFASYLIGYEKEETKGYTILRNLMFVNFLINILAYAFGLFDFFELVQISILLFLALVFYTAYRILKEGIGKKLSQFEFEALAYFLLVILTVVELVRFAICKEMSGLFIRTGVLLFLLSFSLSETIHKEAEKRRLLKHETQLKKEQLAITLSQFQPHFLFNALGAIRLSVRMNPDVAYDMIYDFSKFLRGSLNALQKEEMIPFEKEMEQIHAYLNIEEQRFTNRVKAVYDIESDCFLIPALSVQPFVANAINHGLKKNGGTVTIRSYEDESCHVIEVEDDGCGFDTTGLDHESEQKENYTKITNIENRLKLQTNGKVIITSEPGQGTLVVLKIPK